MDVPSNGGTMTVKIGDFQMEYSQERLAHYPCNKVWKEIRTTIKEENKNAKQKGRVRA